MGMTSTRAKELIVTWREKADALEEAAGAFEKAHMTENARRLKAEAIIFRNCAGVIDKEYGRLS